MNSYSAVLSFFRTFPSCGNDQCSFEEAQRQRRLLFPAVFLALLYLICNVFYDTNSLFTWKYDCPKCNLEGQQLKKNYLIPQFIVWCVTRSSFGELYSIQLMSELPSLPLCYQSKLSDQLRSHGSAGGVVFQTKQKQMQSSKLHSYNIHKDFLCHSYWLFLILINQRNWKVIFSLFKYSL